MLSLHEDLLHTHLSLIETGIQFLHVFQADPVGHHIQRIDIVRLNEVHEVLPILVNRSLPITHKVNACLHQSPNVEVVGLGMIVRYLARPKIGGLTKPA